MVDIWVPPKLLQHSCFLASDCTGDFVGSNCVRERGREREQFVGCDDDDVSILWEENKSTW